MTLAVAAVGTFGYGCATSTDPSRVQTSDAQAAATVPGAAKADAHDAEADVLDAQSSEPLPLGLANGYSGMAKLGANRYLVVHDTKAHRDDARIGIVTVGGENGPLYRPLAVRDWLDPDGRSSDLESACVLPDRDDEALVAESGLWEGRFGRIFHIKVGTDNAEVLHVFKIPDLDDNGSELVGDNYEGMACMTDSRGRILVILGERGGTRHNPNGSLHWATFDPSGGVLSWSPNGTAGVSVSAPGAWVSIETKRDIAALHLDEEGILWAVASEDAGDNGPFRSIIYAVASVDVGASLPIRATSAPSPTWTLDGFKVESIAAPPDELFFAELSFATEDENFGGVWRPLYPGAAD